MSSERVDMKHELPWFLVLPFCLLFAIVSLQKEQSQKPEQSAAQSPTPEYPPIIILSEEFEQYSFSSGSAALSRRFQAALEQKVIPLIDSLAEKYRCNVVEIVGHTDGQRIGPKFKTNLDLNLRRFVADGKTTLSPGSNADLALMRAASLVEFFQSEKRLGHLQKIVRFYPYSAAQLIRPNGTIDTSQSRRPVAVRRRIEIRLVRMEKSHKEIKPAPGIASLP